MLALLIGLEIAIDVVAVLVGVANFLLYEDGLVWSKPV